MWTQRISLRAFGRCFIAAAALFCFAAAQAQSPTPDPITPPQASTATPTLTTAWIKSKIDELTARNDIKPADRDQALALYRDAISQIEAAEASKAIAAEFQETIQSAPKQTAQIRRSLSAMFAPSVTTASITRLATARSPLNDIEQMLDATQAEIATLEAEIGQFDATLQSMTAMPTAARAEQSLQKQKLDQLSSPGATSNVDEDALVAEARRTESAAKRTALAGRVNLLEQELISLPARQALIAAKRDYAAAKLARLEQQVPELEARINDLRQSDTQQKQAQADQVTRQLSGKDPLLEEYAEGTAQIIQTQADLAKATAQDQALKSGMDSEIARIRESAGAAKEILEIGRVGEQLGEFLRQMRAQLPADSSLADRIQDRDKAIVDVRLQRLNVEKTRRTLAKPARAAERMLEAAGKEAQADLSENLQPLIVARREALERLNEAYTRRIDQLAKINGVERELLSQTSQLKALLNERLLWLPSSAPFGRAWLEQAKASLIWFSQPESWKLTGRALNLRSTAKPLLSLAALAAFLALWGSRRRLRNRLIKIAEEIGSPTTDRYLLTPQAIVITALISLHWPVLLGYLGWLLATPPTASEFSAAVGNGLLSAAFVVLLLRFLQLLCMNGGVFQNHFKWSARACQLLRRDLAWLLLIAAPVAFLLGMIEFSNSQVNRDGLGRLIFVVGSVALALFAMRALSPRKGIFAEHLSREGALWLTRGLWYPILWGAPLLLAGLAISGYYDSASELLGRLVVSAAVAVLVLLIYGVAMRQLFVARRRLEMRRRRERSAKARAEYDARNAAEASGEAVPQTADDDDIDVASISQQTRTLLRMFAMVGLVIGLWFIWRQLLPALGVLDDVTLWSQTIASDAGTRIVPVTLSNLLLALAVAVMTFMAAHNLPGLMEIMLLQRLSFAPGTRYAITAISRYLIIAVGLLIAFNRVGADWSQMQWIVAALGVGVGFGLQEIVANFVSGLIILFERPIRVGDTVTVGNLSGTVSRIQIRATSITDWDNREILVPNKALITDQVMNWTLTDTVTRLLLPVGVAYGSDTAMTQNLMLETVKTNPLVLETPPPTVFFLGFGDSALNFEIRAFVGQPAHRLPVQHELHVAIEKALRENGIQIPFPQRDLHFKFDQMVEASQDANAAALRDTLKKAG